MGTTTRINQPHNHPNATKGKDTTTNGGKPSVQGDSHKKQ